MTKTLFKLVNNEQVEMSEDEAAATRAEWAEAAANPPPSGLVRIAKNAIWERATDAEARVMDALLASQSVRVRRIYDGATHIEPDHELFGLLTQALTTAFGADRAAELLAPTD